MQYIDFELKIDRKGDSYNALVIRSPAGEAEGAFSLPFSEDKLENLILKMTRVRANTRRIYSSELEAARELGGMLFQAIFSGNVGSTLRASLQDVDARNDTGLRIKLRLQSVPQLAELPWEFLYDAPSDRFIAQSQRTPIVRYVEIAERIKPLRVQLPLRVLVMISSPTDYPKLDVDREKNVLRQALAELIKSKKVEIEWLENAAMSTLHDHLRANTHHIFHFVGHGGFDSRSEAGVLVMEDENQLGNPIDATRLGTVLHNHQSLRLALLNACEGARNSRTDPFGGLATTLIRQGVPAVIAMQFEITDDAAISFARGFYSALADGLPVDAAVADARVAVYIEPNDIEWGTPVLYMRSPDGILFDLVEAPQITPEPEAAPSSTELRIEKPDDREKPSQPDLTREIAAGLFDKRGTVIRGIIGLASIVGLVVMIPIVLRYFSAEITLSGQVRDSQTKKAIADAKVMLSVTGIPPVYTDVQGAFRIPHLAPELALLRVEAEGYEQYSQDININADALDIRLPASEGVFRIVKKRNSTRLLNSRQIEDLEKLKEKQPDLFRRKDETKFWVSGATLRVRFLNGNEEDQRMARQISQEWTKYANLKFLFVQDGESQIRVSFKEQEFSWSFLGTDALAIGNDQPTMNLLPDRATILHEFGHVLGLIEEYQNPKANIPWNKEVMYGVLGQEQTERLTRKEPVEQIGKYREFDPNSVMLAAIPASWTGGVEFKRNSDLSESDKELARQIYPPQTADDSPFKDNGNGTVTESRTGLMWAARDNGNPISWEGAKRYCENYNAGGFGDWRMPTVRELKSLFDRRHKVISHCTQENIYVTEFIHLSCCCIWSSDHNVSMAQSFHFSDGLIYWGRRRTSTSTGPDRALPVRSAE